MEKTTEITKAAPHDGDIIDVRGALDKVIFHWPLYALLLIISLLGARVYLKYTKPVYGSSAKIYIKDSRSTGNTEKALDELSITGDNKVVENEMEVIKSPLILEDVVRTNGFNIRYFLQGKVVNKELYKISPVSIKILSDSSTVGNYDLNVDLLANNELNVSYPLPTRKERQLLRTHFNQPFNIGKDRFLLQYIPAFNLNEDKEFKITIDSIQPFVYRKSAEINTLSINRMSSVFQLTYEDEIPERTADFLNAVLNAYNEYTLDDKNKITLNTIRFIEGRLASLGDELNVLEKDVEGFKKQRGITELDERSKLVLDQAREADQRLAQSNIQLSIYSEVEKYINNPNGSPFSPVYGNVDPALTNLITRYEDAKKERATLALSVQPGHPMLKEVDDRIESAKNTIRNYISGYRRSAAIERTGIQKQVNQVESQMSQIPTYERQFIDIKRQQNVKENLYNFLLQRKEEAAVSYASNIVDNKVISPAFIPSYPLKPNKMVVYILFLLGGVILATAYIRIKYLLNNTIISKKEIEKITKVPVIAEIYKQENTSRQVSFDERSVLTEQILNLRNNLKFLLTKASDTPVILFTSSISGEGKTFISSHLGNALTYNNKKAVLLEFDLRKPKLSQSVGVSNSSGISNYLAGLETLDHIIKKVPGNNNLFIIPSGPIPPNPIELIESERMKQFMALLRERFDYIIIDTSPVGMVSDAKSFSPYIDCALFVVRFNHTPRMKLRDTAAEMDKSVFHRMGIVFNGVDIESSYGYYSYGYSNYGYGYGTNKPKKSLVSTIYRSLVQRMF